MSEPDGTGMATPLNGAPAEVGAAPPRETGLDAMRDSVRRGRADAEAGRTVPGEAALREFRDAAGALRTRLARDGKARG